MTLEEYRNNTSIEEQELFAKKLHCWLNCYTEEVIFRVWKKLEDILNDKMALTLIDELYIRTFREEQKSINDFKFALCYSDHVFTGADVLTHSKSYRDVLYDMYIKETEIIA